MVNIPFLSIFLEKVTHVCLNCIVLFEIFAKLSENYCIIKTKVLQLRYLKKTAVLYRICQVRRRICEKNPIFHWPGI